MMEYAEPQSEKGKQLLCEFKNRFILILFHNADIQRYENTHITDGEGKNKKNNEIIKTYLILNLKGIQEIHGPEVG